RDRFKMTEISGRRGPYRQAGPRRPGTAVAGRGARPLAGRRHRHLGPARHRRPHRRPGWSHSRESRRRGHLVGRRRDGVGLVRRCNALGGSEFTTSGDQGGEGRMDLLTVLEHEIGHLLGRDHEAPGRWARHIPGRACSPTCRRARRTRGAGRIPDGETAVAYHPPSRPGPAAAVAAGVWSCWRWPSRYTATPAPTSTRAIPTTFVTYRAWSSPPSGVTTTRTSALTVVSRPSTARGTATARPPGTRITPGP